MSGKSTSIGHNRRRHVCPRHSQKWLYTVIPVTTAMSCLPSYGKITSNDSLLAVFPARYEPPAINWG
jgi:hypothetical protein